MSKHISLKKIIATILCISMVLTFLAPSATARADASAGAQAYITRLYELTLLREPDSEGFAHWCRMIENNYSAAQIAQGFFESEEFTNRNTTNEEYLEVLYNVMLGRSSDPTGRADWLSRLSAGMTRRALLSNFVNSAEFSSICANYGMVRGDITMTSVVDTNSRATEFVTRLYTNVLGRQPDSAGLENWVTQIANGGMSCAQALSCFLSSQEFANMNKTNSQYVDTLYLVVLGRGCADSERQYWLDKMDVYGMSRTYVLWGFVGSQEFISLCNSYGLNRGDITLTEGRDYDQTMNLFIINSYKCALGRDPLAEELNSWASYLRVGYYSSDLLLSLFNSSSYATASTTEQAAFAYRLILGREGSSADIQALSQALSSSDRRTALRTLFYSEEFATRCFNNAVLPAFNDGWNIYGGQLYYARDGRLVTGWQRINGARYYFNPGNHGAAASGWLFVDGLKYYFDSEGKLVQDVDAILGPRSSYYLTVNCETNTIMVYAQDIPGGAYNIPVKAIVCSTGMAGTPTVQGDFVIRRFARWGTLMGPVYGQYCSQISGSYLFHSAWYNTNGNVYSLSVSEYNRLGTNASHGCVRLTVADAMWIYNNCNGSTVHIFYSSAAAPFDKPVAPQAGVVYGNVGYDPTDPETWG